MTVHFQREMELLHRDVMKMCSRVEEHIHEAVEGLKARRSDLDREMKMRDRIVNELDVRIEEECLKILALHHPVANDLRRVATVLKISAELERVGDLAVSLAQRSRVLSAYPEYPTPDQLDVMARKALAMLNGSIDSYVALDSGHAREICIQDNEVDALNVELIEEARVFMQKNPDLIEPGMHMFSAIRHLERVADHATNIAEDVVYLVEGEIIRHPNRTTDGV